MSKKIVFASSIAPFLTLILSGVFASTLACQSVTKKPLLSSNLIFPQSTRISSNAVAYLRLEEVSRVDAPSNIVSEQVIRKISHKIVDQNRLEVNLYGPNINRRLDYAVNVHVDSDGNGQINRGDYINTESYPVLTFGRSNQVTVRLKLIS